MMCTGENSSLLVALFDSAPDPRVLVYHTYLNLHNCSFLMHWQSGAMIRSAHFKIMLTIVVG